MEFQINAFLIIINYIVYIKINLLPNSIVSLYNNNNNNDNDNDNDNNNNNNNNNNCYY